ncbi:MAG: hypothetical protein V3U92_06615 [Cellulophaga sp.]
MKDKTSKTSPSSQSDADCNYEPFGGNVRASFVKLRALKIILKTADVKDAGTDDSVHLSYFIGVHYGTNTGPAGWNLDELDKKWDDRERGRSDIYEIDFIKRQIAGGHGGVNSGGIAFDNFEKAKAASFKLQIDGNDAWTISEYFVLGEFVEYVEYNERPIESYKNHGWILMGSTPPKTGFQDSDSPHVTLSTDPSEGASEFKLDFNAVFPEDGTPIVN